jgi:OmpA-OmpF porin, OOP family
MNLKFTIALLVVFVQALTAQPLNNHLLNKANTPYDEMNPVISPDGKTLYMTIANHPLNLGGKKDPGDIWYSTLDGTENWSEPVHGGTLINDRSYNTVAGFSPDGGEMILLGHYDPSGSMARSQGISVSKKQGNTWSRPQNINIPYFQNKSSFSSGYVNPEMTVLIYSAEAYGSYGVEDLFVCEKKADGKWSEPTNLGAKINTQFQELAPSLSRDGRTLYFSTNGRKGQGSFDIYSSTRIGDSWTNWSDPENIAMVNSDGRDLYYREYPGAGYSLYTTTKNSDGYGDIKMFAPKDPFPVDTTSVAAVVKPPVQITETPVNDAPVEETIHTVALHGKVVNAKTGEAIPAVISFETRSSGVQGPGKINADAAGYSASIPSTNQYVVTIESKGFISSREKLDIQTYEMKDLEMNFKLQPIEVGTTVELKDVLFEQSKTTLLPQSFDELNLVVSFMKANPNVRIELGGHTDNRGIPSQNVKLSQGRVDKVKEYLITKGIEGKRISGKGYGGNKPIASNDTEDTRKLNRRVEFTIRKN